MHLKQMQFGGNPNVGLFGFATDSYCIVGNTVPDEDIKLIKEILKVPVVQTNIASTPLVGTFLSGTKEHLLVPHTITPEERKALDALQITITLVPTKHTALGNNILCNEQVILVHPELEQEARRIIRDALNIPIHDFPIAKLPTVGSLAVLNEKGCLTTSDASDEELDAMEKLLAIPCDIGTVNFGSPFVGAGIICNSNGFIIGQASTGLEVNNADEVLGFLEE